MDENNANFDQLASLADLDSIVFFSIDDRF